MKMNLTIVQLSDLHGRTRFLNGTISKMVNRIHPDYVVITGDLVSRKQQLKRVMDEISRIQCENIVFVPGNYERETMSDWHKREYSEEEYNGIIEQLQQRKMICLENDFICNNVNGHRLLIYGFDNSKYGNERNKMTEVNPLHNDFVLMLAHSPNIVQLIERNQLDYDLLLVGHTHGGQIRVFGRTIGAYKHFHVGMKRMDARKHFYIHRGLGTVKFPVRMACPPEIAVFTI